MYLEMSETFGGKICIIQYKLESPNVSKVIKDESTVCLSITTWNIKDIR